MAEDVLKLGQRVRYLEARVAELEAERDVLQSERDELLKKTVDQGWPVPAKLPENYWESAQ